MLFKGVDFFFSKLFVLAYANIYFNRRSKNHFSFINQISFRLKNKL